MDKAEARSERARLQKLLDGYEAWRGDRQGEDECFDIHRQLTPDRADNVRARIARLDQFIADE